MRTGWLTFHDRKWLTSKRPLTKGADGEYYPLSYQQDGLGIFQDAIEWDDNGDIKGFKAKMQADMTSFANDWMKNIRDQQKI